MTNKKKIIDPIPETFDSYEEAAEFWDSHDTTDYPENWHPVKVISEFRERRYDLEKNIVMALEKQTNIRNEFFLIKYEVSQIQQFLEFNNSAIEHYRVNFGQWLLEKSQDMPDDQKKEFLSFHHANLLNMNFDFPNIFFSNFVTTWFSFLEVSLFEICKTLDLKVTVDINEKVDIRDGIDRARTFLVKGAEYNFKPDTWEELDYIRKIRNIIIHNQGRINYSYNKSSKKNSSFVELKPFGDVLYVNIDKKFFAYLESYHLYDVFDYVYIRPTLSYCRHLITFAKELFDDLDKNLATQRF